MSSTDRQFELVRAARILLSSAVVALSLAACGTDDRPVPADKPSKAELDPLTATITDVHQLLESGALSCQDLISTYLERIETLDASSGLNAIIFTNPNALVRAAEIDRLLEQGQAQGALYCIPVLLKDNMDTADMPTSGGSIALKESVPPDDAFIVRRLREAGAIIIAKTNMAEWAFSAKQTLSSSYGVTANAYDLTRVPAGSSGGTASAVAAGFGVIGMGSDTGNSIRGPSSHLARSAPRRAPT